MLETGATLKGDVLDVGDTTVTERGFDWDADGSSPFTNSWTETGSFGTGPFSHAIGSLDRGILYYFRGKAVNEALPGEWGYGVVVRFLTRPAVPTGFTAVAGDNQNSLSWQKGQGALRTLIRRSTGGFPVNPTDGNQVYLGADNTTVDSGLVNGTPYYYSAWSEVTRDTFQQYSSTYATVQSTPDNAPDVVTDNVTSLTGVSATLNALITNIYGENVAERGFDWDINSGEPYANSWTETGSFGVSSYSHPLAGLPKGQVYYYRGKAKHAAAIWGYGQEMQFITKPDPPTAFTSAAAGNRINLSWAKGAGAYATYICRSTTGYPVHSDDGTFIYFGTGTAFSDNISISTCVRYYYSAWSVSAGGDVAEFSDVKADSTCVIYAAPGVTTNDAIVTSPYTATLQGTLTSLCQEPAVQISFEWGTIPGVYTSTTPHQLMTNTGDFSQVLSGLGPGMTCYYRAKVENQVTGYGLEKSFTTPLNNNNTGSSGTSSTGSPSLPVPLPSVSVQSASLSVVKVAQGSPVTVNAVLANKGTANGSAVVKLYVNGREEASRAVTVGSGKTAPLSFILSRDEPGTYSVYVGGVNAGSFVVDGAANPDIVLFFSAAMVFSAFVLGMIYVWKRRRSV